MTKKEIQECLDELESTGLIRKTGRFRPDRYGVPRPIYEAVPEEELDEAAKTYAQLIQKPVLPYA